MSELFETVLILSALGFGLILVLLCLKPVTAKKFPAKWQYYAWIAVLITMIVPIYKFIPDKEVKKIHKMTQAETPVVNQNVPNLPVSENTAMPEIDNNIENVTNVQNIQQPVADVGIQPTEPVTEEKIIIDGNTKVKFIELLSVIWISGFVVFMLFVIVSYILYILRKRKNSVLMEQNEILTEVKERLKIRRNIRVRMSPDVGSPMLVGALFPVVYMPCIEIPKDMMRMVFLHELTHYKRKDLIIKWFALIVNAVHWFNPLSYILCANLSESCEISCDMEVTENMNDEHQKLYMKTILDLVEQ